MYRDDVMYDLSTGNIIVRRALLRFVEDSAELSNKNKKTVSFNVTNVAPYDVTIDKMNVSWELDEGEELKWIRIDGVEVWNKNVASGTTVDINDTTIAAGDTATVELGFNQDMTNKTFIAEFIYTDGLSDSITFQT